MTAHVEKDDSSLYTLSENIITLETHFEKLREDIVSKLNECSECIKTGKKLCQEATEMTANLKDKLANASDEEKQWKNIQVKLATTLIEGMVILNVGGVRYTTSVETLTREKNTFFTALFSEQWHLSKNPKDESIFIDRNGKVFHHILEYLRTNVIFEYIISDEILRKNLLVEAEYFRLHNLIHILEDPFSTDGTLLKAEHQKKLNEFYGNMKQRWKLIYKASRDGFDAKAFHSRCDNRGPTMTIILSNNNWLFGGYTAIPWTSNNTDQQDTTAFLFTLTNPHGFLPTKYFIKPNSVAVSHDPNDGVKFGSGRDIKIESVSNANNSSYTNFPFSYVDTTGKGNSTFTGAKNFTTSDIEIFELA